MASPVNLSADIQAAVQRCISQDPNCRMLLIVARKSRPRSDRVRLWPRGPSGRVVGQVTPGRWMVDVLARDLVKALG